MANAHAQSIIDRRPTPHPYMYGLPLLTADGFYFSSDAFPTPAPLAATAPYAAGSPAAPSAVALDPVLVATAAWCDDVDARRAEGTLDLGPFDPTALW